MHEVVIVVVSGDEGGEVVDGFGGVGPVEFDYDRALVRVRLITRKMVMHSGRTIVVSRATMSVMVGVGANRI